MFLRWANPSKFNSNIETEEQQMPERVRKRNRNDKIWLLLLFRLIGKDDSDPSSYPIHTHTHTLLVSYEDTSHSFANPISFCSHNFPRSLLLPHHHWMAQRVAFPLLAKRVSSHLITIESNNPPQRPHIKWIVWINEYISTIYPSNRYRFLKSNFLNCFSGPRSFSVFVPWHVLSYIYRV